MPIKLTVTTLALLLLARAVPESQVSADRMRADVEFLASAPLEGRVSLSRGADEAARFIAAEMKKIGLRPAGGADYLQRFDVVPLRLDRERSSMVVSRSGEEHTFPIDAAFFPNPARALDLTLSLVFAGFGITAPEVGYDDYAAVDVTGKAVLVLDHEPQEDNPRSIFNGRGFTLHANAWTKTQNAQVHGAAAVLLVTEPINPHRSVPRAPLRANAPPQGLAESELRIPRFSVSQDAAAALVRGSGRTLSDWQSEIERGPAPASHELQGVRVHLKAANSDQRALTSFNVAGLLPGTDPRLRRETILVSSHFDHLGLQDGRVYPGANDNASGVAAMLETARQLTSRPPARSVLFVSFGSEEQLMLGSYHYVAHPLRPLETTRAVLNLDMIGRNEEHTPESLGAYEVTAGRSDQLNLVGAGFSPDLEGVLQRESQDAGLSLSRKFDGDSSMRALFRCDHLPFLQKGVPAVWLFGGFHPGYHEPVDMADRLDYGKMTRVVRLTVAATRALAATSAAPRFTARQSPASTPGFRTPPLLQR